MDPQDTNPVAEFVGTVRDTITDTQRTLTIVKWYAALSAAVLLYVAIQVSRD